MCGPIRPITNCNTTRMENPFYGCEASKMTPEESNIRKIFRLIQTKEQVNMQIAVQLICAVVREEYIPQCIISFQDEVYFDEIMMKSDFLDQWKDFHIKQIDVAHMLRNHKHPDDVVFDVIDIEKDRNGDVELISFFKLIVSGITLEHHQLPGVLSFHNRMIPMDEWTCTLTGRHLDENSYNIKTFSVEDDKWIK